MNGDLLALGAVAALAAASVARRGSRATYRSLLGQTEGITEDVGQTACWGVDDKVIYDTSTKDGMSHMDGILHTSCDGKSYHHIRRFVDGEAVAGITLRAKQAWRGLQSATIHYVYTDEAHRREGYAADMLKYARGHFRSVKHSKDLTDAGASWKRAMR